MHNVPDSTCIYLHVHRFLPMYEYHVKRYLPAHIQLPHTFLKSHMPNMSRFTEQYRYTLSNMKRSKDICSLEETDEQDELYNDIPPVYELHPSHGKHSMTPFIGSIQVRVRYSFQHPPDSDESDTLSPFYFNHTNRSIDTFQSYITSSRKSSCHRSSSYSSSSEHSTNSTAYTRTKDFHDAVEPRLVLVDDLENIMSSNTTSPATPKPKTINTMPKSESMVDMMFHQNLDHGFRRQINLEQYKVDFPKTDGENKNKSNEVMSDTASIKSHNFGDKNFAFRWINESFEEVAISHPSLDRMIGMVVSPQTRILLRAVVKMFNAFVRLVSDLLGYIYIYIIVCGILNVFCFRDKVSRSPYFNYCLHYLYCRISMRIFQGL